MSVTTIKPADATHTDVVHGQDIDYIEYGIQFPNGKIAWGSYVGYGFGGSKVDHHRLNLAVEQEKAQKAFERHLEQVGVPYSPEHHRLRFVQRVQQVRFTAPQPLAGEELREFEAAS